MIAQAYIETGFYTALKAIQLWKIAYTTPIGIMIWIEQGIQHGTPWFGAACMTLGGIVVFFWQISGCVRTTGQNAAVWHWHFRKQSRS